MSTDERREIQVADRHEQRLKKKGYVYYDRDARTPDDRYIDEDLAVVLDLLQPRRRRILIRCLGELEPRPAGLTIGFDELAREIVAIEDDAEPHAINRRSHESVKGSLQKGHLERLERYDVLEWDRDQRTIRTTERLEPLAQLLERMAYDITLSPVGQWGLDESLDRGGWP